MDILFIADKAKLSRVTRRESDIKEESLEIYNIKNMR